VEEKEVMKWLKEKIQWKNFWITVAGIILMIVIIWIFANLGDKTKWPEPNERSYYYPESR